MKKPDASSPPLAAPVSTVATGLQALEWAVTAGNAEKVVGQIRVRQRRRRRLRIMALVGSAVALLMAGAIWRARPSLSVSAPAAVPAMTGRPLVSVPAMRILPDGSVVELRDGAAIVADFSGPLRRVVLRSGEAHFQVAKNPTRPFVVDAAGVKVRAVGTAFSVQLGARAIDVLVTEGRVAVEQTPMALVPMEQAVNNQVTSGPAFPPSPSPAQPSAPIFVDAGNRVTVETVPQGLAPPVVAVSALERNERLAWRVPRLEFSGTPLSEAIPMFNAYGRTKLSLDPALGRLQMSGVLRADDSDSLLLLLKNEFKIEAEHRGDDEVHLRRK